MTFRFLLCVIAVSVASASAISKELQDKVYKELVLPHVLACSSEFAVAGDKIDEAKNKGNAEGISPCFFNCVFKGIGILDEQGKFKPDGVVEKAKKIIADEEDLKTISEITNSCSKVNDVDVSEECERATLLFKCAVENKALLLTK